MSFSFRVYGRPAPQGSKKSIGNNRFIEASKYLPAWRAAVKQAAQEAMTADFEQFTSAVELSITFTLQRPSSVKNRPYPIVPPDLSKLIRGAEDAITDAGVWADDSLVIRIVAEKFYADLEEPGAVIKVTKL